MKMEVIKRDENKEAVDQHEIDEAVRILIRAKEIEHDPELMAACSAQLGKKKKAINSIEGLRDKANQMDREEDEE